MFNKVSIKTLAIIFAGLLVITVISEMANRNRGERTFKSELTNFDREQVSKIEILNNEGEELVLRKGSGKWIIQSGDNEYLADSSTVKNMISTVSNLKPERVVALDEEKWSDFEVNDSLGLRVKIYNEDETLADLYVGKFKYSVPQNAGQNMYGQPNYKLTSYVRPANEDKVYAVDGFLKMTFNQDLNNLRFSKLTDVRSQVIGKISIESPRGSYTLNKEDNTWTLAGQPVDSAAMNGYVNNLANLSNRNFVEYEPVSGPAYKILIEGNMDKPIELSGYLPDSLVSSSLNPGVYFDGTTSDLFTNVFKEKNELVLDE